MVNHVTLRWDHVVDFDSLDSIRENYLREHGGIYVWIINTTDKRVFYIGEAENFLNRFIQHFTSQFSGRYTVCDVPPDMDFTTFLDEYFHEKNVDEMYDSGKIFIPESPSKEFFKFKKAFSGHIIEASRRMMAKMSFAFATVDGDDSLSRTDKAKQRKQVEAALIHGMREWYKTASKKGEYIRYVPREGCRSDLIIGSISQYPQGNMTLEHIGNTAGIPAELLKIISYK